MCPFPVKASFSPVSASHDVAVVAPRVDVGLASVAVHGQTLDGLAVTLDDLQGLAGVVLVQVVDVAGQGQAEQMVLLPQAAQLLVQDIGAQGKGGHSCCSPHVPQLGRLVPRG